MTSSTQVRGGAARLAMPDHGIESVCADCGGLRVPGNLAETPPPDPQLCCTSAANTAMATFQRGRTRGG